MPLLARLTSGRYGRPPLDWYRALLSCCLELERTDRARAAVDALLADHPSDAEAWRLAGQAALAREDYRSGAVALTVAGYLEPPSRAQSLQLGDLYHALSAPARACRHYEAALADSATAAELEKLATAYLAAHEALAAAEPDRSRPHLEHVLKRAGRFSAGLILAAAVEHADRLQALGQGRDRAARFFKKALATDPEALTALARLTRLIRRADKEEQALKLIEQIKQGT